MCNFVFVENLKETLNLGKKLSHKLNPQSIVLLQGPVGAGKTSFVQGIAKGLSISEDITSPTFALSHHYNSGKIPLIHLDLYRLEDVSSAKECHNAELALSRQMAVPTDCAFATSFWGVVASSESHRVLGPFSCFTSKMLLLEPSQLLRI